MRRATLMVLTTLACPAGVVAQGPGPAAVDAAVAALKGLQSSGSLPADAERLRTIRLEEGEPPDPQRSFDLLVLAAVGMATDAEGSSRPECEFRRSVATDRGSADEPTWLSRCALPRARVPVSFHVTEMGRSSARIIIRWLTVAEGDEFLFFPASYVNYEVRVVRDRESSAWRYDGVVGRSSAAVHPRPGHAH